MSKGKTILLIEDDPAIAMIIRETLVGECGHFASVASLAERNAWLAGNRPDLIITDVSMPVIDGGTLVGILRAREETRHAPVLGITGLSDLRRANDAYFTEVIHKPFDIDDLVSTVDRLLEQSART